MLCTIRGCVGCENIAWKVAREVEGPCRSSIRFYFEKLVELLFKTYRAIRSTIIYVAGGFPWVAACVRTCDDAKSQESSCKYTVVHIVLSVALVFTMKQLSSNLDL